MLCQGAGCKISNVDVPAPVTWPGRGRKGGVKNCPAGVRNASKGGRKGKARKFAVELKPVM